MRAICLFILLLTTSSCVSVSGHKHGDLEYSLKSIQKAISEKIYGGLHKVSENRREFISYYFLPGDLDTRYRSKTNLYRARAHVFVLGDRRPYDLVTQVKIQGRRSNPKEIKTVFSHEDLTKGKWVDVKEDSGLAKRIAKTIIDSLKKDQRNKNLIDDFRAF